MKLYRNSNKLADMELANYSLARDRKAGPQAHRLRCELEVFRGASMRGGKGKASAYGVGREAN